MQIINVYNQEYESSAAFWPDVHGRVVAALIISQLLLMGLLSTKEAASSTPFLLALPIMTIGFHMYCKGRFEPAFIRYPLQVYIYFFSEVVEWAGWVMGQIRFGSKQLVLTAGIFVSYFNPF